MVVMNYHNLLTKLADELAEQVMPAFLSTHPNNADLVLEDIRRFVHNAIINRLHSLNRNLDLHTY